MTKLYIKNMVCNRCIMVVTDAVEKLGVKWLTVNLGEVEFAEPLSGPQLEELRQNVEKLGFEILDDPHKQVIESIKKLLIEQVQSQEIEGHFSLSNFLSKELNRDYSTLSKLFSQVEGITIEQFFILQKIEKVKELLFYKQLSLSEIAWQLGYSSVQHLSMQFKKVTGLTPTQLKSMSDFKRKPLDQTH